MRKGQLILCFVIIQEASPTAIITIVTGDDDLDLNIGTEFIADSSNVIETLFSETYQNTSKIDLLRENLTMRARPAVEVNSSNISIKLINYDSYKFDSRGLFVKSMNIIIGEDIFNRQPEFIRCLKR